MVRIVADENIPLIRETLSPFADVELIAGGAIDSAIVRDADVLLVRSVTRVDRRLLGGSRVRFVGTATAGTDHVDEAYLNQQGIRFAHAPGSNADSVVEYVIAALYTLAGRYDVALGELMAGVIGVGNVGGRLVSALRAIGMRVLVNDPPLEEAGVDFAPECDHVGLHDLLSRSNVVTLHVPLQKSGKHPTFHLLDASQLNRVRRGSWLFNTSRGAVVESSALKSSLAAGRMRAVLDVWENEPRVDEALVSQADIVTPHIAGYGREAKRLGSQMILGQLAHFLGVKLPESPSDRKSLQPLVIHPRGDRCSDEEWMDFLIRQVYDIRNDDSQMRAAISSASDVAGEFTRLRREYPARMSFRDCRVGRDDVPERLRGVVTGLGFTASSRQVS